MQLRFESAVKQYEAAKAAMAAQAYHV
jgi:hypothetical protein